MSVCVFIYLPVSVCVAPSPTHTPSLPFSLAVHVLLICLCTPCHFPLLLSISATLAIMRLLHALGLHALRRNQKSMAMYAEFHPDVATNISVSMMAFMKEASK